MVYRILFFALLLFLASIGVVGAAHITDKLVVGVYSEPKVEGTPLQLLSSGTPIDVLRRKDGFAEVRLVDNTTGWIEVGYVMEEKPAKAMLLETQARLRQMGMELAALREQSSGGGESAVSVMPPNAREAELRQALERAEARITELESVAGDRESAEMEQQELARLRENVLEAVAILAASQGLALQPEDSSADPGWFIRYRLWIVGLVALVLGFGIGVAFIDRRIRKRYGGFRM